METLLKKIYKRLLHDNLVESQVEFANILKYTEGYISEALDKEKVSPKMQKKLNIHFGISKEYMTTGTGSMFITKFPEQPNPLPVKNTPVEHREKYPNSESDGVVSSSFNQNDLAMTNALIEALREISTSNRELAATNARLVAKIFPDEEKLDRTKSK